MILNNNTQIKTLNINIHSEINPTNVVLYKDDLDSYVFILKLIEHDSYYIIPDNTKIILKLDNIEIPSLNYEITDKYRGTIKLIISSSYFSTENNFIDTALSHILTLNFYSESTFGLHQYTIAVPITVTTGKDPGNAPDDGTTVVPPTMPSPDWNLTQGDTTPEVLVKPDIDIDNIDENLHIIFDGGEYTDDETEGLHLIYDGGEFF